MNLHPFCANCDKMNAHDTNVAGPKQRKPLAHRRLIIPTLSKSVPAYLGQHEAKGRERYRSEDRLVVVDSLVSSALVTVLLSKQQYRIRFDRIPWLVHWADSRALPMPMFPVVFLVMEVGSVLIALPAKLLSAFST